MPERKTTVCNQHRPAECAFSEQVVQAGTDEVFGRQTYARLRRLTGPALAGRDTILDLGCGTGCMTRAVLTARQRLYVDLHPRSVRRAKQLDPSSASWFVVADISRLPLRQHALPAATLFSVCHHFPDPRCLIDELWRVLQPEGVALVFDKNRRHPLVWLLRDSRSPFRSRDGQSDNERPVDPAALAGDFVRRGFRVSVVPVSGVDFITHHTAVGRKFLPLLNLLERLFAGLAPLTGRWAQHVMLVVRKPGLAGAAGAAEAGTGKPAARQ